MFNRKLRKRLDGMEIALKQLLIERAQKAFDGSPGFDVNIKGDRVLRKQDRPNFYAMTMEELRNYYPKYDTVVANVKKETAERIVAELQEGSK